MLMKRLLGFALVLALAGCAAPRRAQAQFIGYVSPQTTQQTIATNLACTGSTQTFAVNNLGQTQHYLTVSAIGATTQFQAVIQGVDNIGNTFPISDQIQTVGTVKGSGYYPKVQVQVTCIGSTFSASYSGAWGTYDSSSASYLLAQIDKLSFSNATENANHTNLIQTPFGTSAGSIFFIYGTAGAGGTLTVQCDTANDFSGPIVFSAALANTTSLQTFTVPAFTCPYVFLTYGNNSTGGVIFTEYSFAPPGTIPSAYQYTHVTGTTATVAKATTGFLHTVTINTGGAGTLSVFDLASASCTGTPATNTIAVITSVAATLQTFTFDVGTQNGICVKASVAMDFTVSSQ